ncbi:MAG: formyltransferase family protein [Zetaproteobacteria bacterium]|nr:formyltransferase family protein [Zetaproteobacteria bacterium]
MTPPACPIVIAASGTGRSFANLLDHPAHNHKYKIVGLIASRENCKAVNIAAERGLDTIIEPFHHETQAHQKIAPWLRARGAKWVVLAGFLKRFPTTLLQQNYWKVINIHPSLLPKYGGKGMYGMHVHRAVVAAQESYSGATVHYANAEYDQGTHISQGTVKISPEDTPEQLADKVFQLECQLLPETLIQLITKESHRA